MRIGMQEVESVQRFKLSIKKSYFFFEKIMDNFYEKKTSYLKRNVQ